jgi:hypothetical protein
MTCLCQKKSDSTADQSNRTACADLTAVSVNQDIAPVGDDQAESRRNLEGLLGFQVLVLYRGRSFVLTGPLADKVREVVRAEVAEREPGLELQADRYEPIWAR